MELISMTDFVLEQNEKLRKDIHDNYNKLLIPQCCDRIFNYANFLKKPLKLGYFIACDENDVPLEDLPPFKLQNETEKEAYNRVCKYKEAKQRDLFEGFEYDKENDWVTYNEFARFFVSELQNGKVENLFKLIKDEITLTGTAKKEIVL